MLCAAVEVCDFLVWAQDQYILLRYAKDINVCNDMIRNSESYFKNAIIPELLSKYYSRLWQAMNENN